MFGKADDPTRLAQAAYKKYNDKQVRVKNRLHNDDMGFLDGPKRKPNTANGCDEYIAKSNFDCLKLLNKSSVTFRVICVYPDVIVIEQDGNKVLVSVNRCTHTTPETTVPASYILFTGSKNPDFSFRTASLPKKGPFL